MRTEEIATVGDISRHAVAMIEVSRCRVFNIFAPELWTPSFMALDGVKVAFGHPVRQETGLHVNRFARHAKCSPACARAPVQQAANGKPVLIFATSPPPENGENGTFMIPSP